MVSLTTIRQRNLSFAASHPTGYSCVFAGATSGIGAATLERMFTMLNESTFYIIGRSETRFAAQRVKLENLNPNNTIVFLEGEFSLLADVDAVCERIGVGAEKGSMKRVDLLYMSPGMYPLNGPEYTKEGLETCFAISYYSRLRLLSNLLPLLRRSPNPRILNVLSGGREKAILETDIGLEKPENWSSRAIINHTTTMTSLAFYYLAEKDENREIVFIHSFPGLVRTQIFARQTRTGSEGSGWLWRVMLPILRVMFAVLMVVLGVDVEESGESMAFVLTSERFGRGGVRLVSEKCEVSEEGGVLRGYLESGWRERVWEFTEGVFERVIAR
ncbi:hypothetical protein DL98DRAFT_573219 [Cadophora sp. DSE1049]|nr:hypothetical protein DL98DRAFT_573219 [Cadophora sp. DSE1049]